MAAGLTLWEISRALVLLDGQGLHTALFYRTQEPAPLMSRQLSTTIRRIDFPGDF